MVTVTGVLSVTGTADISSRLRVTGILTAESGLTVSSGGLRVCLMFVYLVWSYSAWFI